MFLFLKTRIILTTAVRLSPSFAFPLIGNQNVFDQDEINKVPSETPKTGFERVKKMFRKNEFGEISAELNTALQMSFCGTFFGACMGGFLKSKDAYMSFMENNQATIFTSTMQAKKKLQDYVTVAFAKGAYYWGWRLGIFTGIFGLITTTVSVYRNDSSIIEYVTAGAITGAIYKANLGIAAMMVGAGLGATLSFVGGIAILGILKITGRSMDEIRTSLLKIKQGREEQYNEMLEKAATEKHDNLTLHHDDIVQGKIEKLNDLS